MSKVIKSYDAKLDSKNRITIRNAKYEYYHVLEYENGIIVLQPRELVKPDDVSEEQLKTMDKAIANIENGIVYGPIKIK